MARYRVTMHANAARSTYAAEREESSTDAGEMALRLLPPRRVSFVSDDPSAIKIRVPLPSGE